MINAEGKGGEGGRNQELWRGAGTIRTQTSWIMGSSSLLLIFPFEALERRLTKPHCLIPKRRALASEILISSPSLLTR